MAWIEHHKDCWVHHNGYTAGVVHIDAKAQNAGLTFDWTTEASKTCESEQTLAKICENRQRTITEMHHNESHSPRRLAEADVCRQKNHRLSER